MTKEQAEKWLVDNGFYTEYDKPSNETHLSEAAISVDDEHVEIVMKLTKEKKRTISLDAYLKMQNNWLLLLIEDEAKKDSGYTRQQLLTCCQDSVDALLKHNDVVVEGE